MLEYWRDFLTLQMFTSRHHRPAAIVMGLFLLFFLLIVKGDAMAALIDGQLSPCPNTPNCVCSEADRTSSAYIAAFQFTDAPMKAWERLRLAIVSSGGTIHSDNGGYLTASYTSRWLRFVDDVELRMDENHQSIQVRSASRVGRSDFGVNRKRVEKLRLLVAKRE